MTDITPGSPMYTATAEDWLPPSSIPEGPVVLELAERPAWTDSDVRAYATVLVLIEAVFGFFVILLLLVGESAAAPIAAGALIIFGGLIAWAVAPVVMLTYPWEWQQSPTIGLNDLNYYAPRTDPNGPAMTDAIHAIDSLALGVAGCPAYHYALQSVQPFIQPPYDQFTEARGAQGTLTFLTGEGGFRRRSSTAGAAPLALGPDPAGAVAAEPVGGQRAHPVARLSNSRSSPGWSET